MAPNRHSLYCKFIDAEFPSETKENFGEMSSLSSLSIRSARSLIVFPFMIVFFCTEFERHHISLQLQCISARNSQSASFIFFARNKRTHTKHAFCIRGIWLEWSLKPLVHGCMKNGGQFATLRYHCHRKGRPSSF